MRVVLLWSTLGHWRIISFQVLRFTCPYRRLIRAIAVIVEKLLTCFNTILCKYANPVITRYQHYLGITIWIRRVICKFQLISFAVCIKHELVIQVEKEGGICPVIDFPTLIRFSM